ncbi:DUF262 domain-containing protein [Rhodoferax antarcticus]|uniref:DUF262 domain-containing protein n=1 Tax=Rhodoferax antarcticus TaxID=81479 RepID=UPI0022259F7D|nr:DUF262 domain-containing protein [Rhodoferax antarcticus]MCW2312228.1 uncharacterized protein with ParB-like and HNH nuclease domain [Rhodoferax antarcticus]
MSYKSEPIAVTVERMNRQYFLPAIQREFVWKPEQIVQLFDSIMRGYPISSFLFWSLKPENKSKWQVYKFIDRAKQGGTHNELASTDGVDNLISVLDGQQRLTSLMIGLKGIYELKRKYARRDTVDTWTPHRLYIDLLADPQLDAQGSEAGTYFKIEFKSEEPKPSADHFWYRVGQILDLDSQQKLEDFLDTTIDALELDRQDRRVFARNLEKLYKAIHVDDVIAYYTEYDQDYDRVLDIFVRANDGGTKLSKSDLLLSMVTSKWAGMNARDEIFRFVDSLNTAHSRKNDFDKDFIMKSCLVLTDLPVVYKVQNFDNTNLELIRDQWESIKAAIRAGVSLINSFGIDRENLTSVNAMIPVIYYLYKNPGRTLLGSTPFDVRNSDRIRRWLIMALLKGAFGRAADGLLTGIRSRIHAIASPDADFPLEEVNAMIDTTGMKTAFDDSAIDDILSKTYQGKQTFLALSLLYDDATWTLSSFHQDHIFASNSFKDSDVFSVPLEWLVSKNRIGNLCLLKATENMGKQDMPVEEWLETRAQGFLKRHLIPEDRSLWALDQFPQFLEAREKLIRDRYKSLFAG